MFIKKILAVSLALVMASVSAKDSTKFEGPAVKLAVKPCILQLTETAWGNANSLESVWVDHNMYDSRTGKYGNTGVVWAFGRNMVMLLTPIPELVIREYIAKVDRECQSK